MDNQKLKTELNNIQDLEKYVGKEIGITDWFQITQDDINSFAKLTHDDSGFILILKNQRNIHLIKQL